jgi:ribonuclease T2
MRTWAICATATAVALALIGSAAPARADVTMTGTFTAAQTCPAYQSVRWFNNAGGVDVAPGQAYPVVAKNKPDVTHYRIVVAGAKPQERWVWAACGTYTAAGLSVPGAATVPAGGAPSAPTPPQAVPSPTTIQPPPVALAPAPAVTRAPPAKGTRATHVLAMGWEPAFCAKHQDKTECRELTSTSFGATHLSLHGLWPQPRGTQYCNVAPDIKQRDQNHDWSSLPEPQMSAATLQRLSAVMPGVKSNLQRHEWIVHGTCHGSSADAYFARASDFAEAVNASKVSNTFAAAAGRYLSAAAIRTAFDEAFGPGAGARVAVSCNGRGAARKVTELVIHLAGDVAGSAPLGELMRSADAIPQGCPGGLIEGAPR